MDESSEIRQFGALRKLVSEHLAEHEEILRHKWLESEKVGKDVGYSYARLDWVMKHRRDWSRVRKNAGGADGR